jgi:hypothetical protein
MKKTLLLLVLLVLLGGIVIAQEKKGEAHKNAIYFGTTDLFGIAASYERMLGPNFSLVIESGAGVILAESFYAALRGRWFPVSDSNFAIFISSGLGYGQLEKKSFYFMWEKDDTYEIYGGLISPGIGIKFGYGKPRGFVLTTALDYNIILGEKTTLHEDYNDDPKFGVGLNLNVKLLFGFAF